MARTEPREKSRRSPGGDFVEFSSGQFVMKEGDRGTEMYIVEQGEVELLHGAAGAESRLLVLKRGDFFGEESLVAKLPRLTSARALSDCRLLPVDESTLREILDQGAEVCLKILGGSSQRLREALRLVSVAPAAAKDTEKVSTDKVKKPKIKAIASSQRLVHTPSGTEIEIPERDEVKIGRHDSVTGTDPDIDLAEFDSEHSLSRAHAQMYRRDGKIFVADDVGSANGTYVNGKRVKKGSPVELKEGDEIRFGLVETRFHTAG